MMSRIGSGLAFAAVAALIGCSASGTSPRADRASSASSRSTPGGAAEVQALYGTAHREDGVVLQGDHAGAHWTKWAAPDGTLRLSAGHGLFTDTGKFVLRGNEICSTWAHIDAGKENCVRPVKIGADEYATYLPDGSENATFRVSAP